MQEEDAFRLKDVCPQVLDPLIERPENKPDKARELSAFVVDELFIVHVNCREAPLEIAERPKHVVHRDEVRDVRPSVLGVTVRVVLPKTIIGLREDRRLEAVAVMVTVPRLAPVTTPEDEATVATDVLEDVHVKYGVRSIVEPSLNCPVPVKARVLPMPTKVVEDVTVIVCKAELEEEFKGVLPHPEIPIKIEITKRIRKVAW